MLNEWLGFVIREKTEDFLLSSQSIKTPFWREAAQESAQSENMQDLFYDGI